MAIDKWETLTNTSNAIFGPTAPSLNWYSGFLHRHPDMRTVVATKMEAGRHTNARGHVTSSFERTGIFPLSLERCLERDGVRHISSELRVLEDMANAKKRKRASINGLILTSQDAIQMLEAENKAKSGTAQAKRPRGRPPKKKVFDVDDYDE